MRQVGIKRSIRHVDHVVIGLGGLGSAAAYWLAQISQAKSGTKQKIVGLEQFQLGHENGASHDHSRIIRYSYHTPEYVRLAFEAYETWDHVASEANEEMVVRTGGVDLYPKNCAISMDTYLKSLDSLQVPYELWNASLLMKKYPQFLVKDDVVAVYQKETGIAPAMKGTATHQRLAKARGVDLFSNSPVDKVFSDGKGNITVESGNHSFQTNSVIICADAWTNEILQHIGYQIPLEITREQVVYYPLSNPSSKEFSIGNFPVWIWMDDPSYYGFPVYGDMTAVKAAEDVGGEPTTARTRNFLTNEAALSRLTNFLSETIPNMVTDKKIAPRVKTCLYTLTRDRDFVLDTVPGHPGIQVALGSAHGFKYASWFGRALAERAILGKTRSNIAPFRLDRPAITDPNYKGNYIV